MLGALIGEHAWHNIEERIFRANVVNRGGCSPCNETLAENRGAVPHPHVVHVHDLKHLVPVGVNDRGRRNQYPGIVHDDICAAKLFFRKVGQRLYLCIVTDIAGEASGFHAQVFQGDDGSIEFILSTTGNNDFGTRSTETFGKGESNAGSPPGNDDYFIVEVLQDMSLQVCTLMFGAKPSVTGMTRTARVCLFSYDLPDILRRRSSRSETILRESC